MSTLFRKRPIEVEAIRWTGDNEQDLTDFCGRGYFGVIDPEDRGDDPDQTAQVLDILHSVWIPFCPGDWVIRGVKGELYPCKADVFAETYEQVEVTV